MTLGERICSLRTAQKLSQSDLAETLEVSRQSVSKWETDASVPDLDRLVRMSQLFGVSLDDLVLGEQSEEAAEEAEEEEPEAPEPPPTGPDHPPAQPPHFLAAVVLFCTAGIMALLGVLLVGVFGLVLGVPALLCGCVTLASRRHPGLWCTWTIWSLVILYLQFGTGIRWSIVLLLGTGIRWSIVLLTMQDQWEWNYTRLAFGWLMVLTALGLLLGTAWRLRKEAWTHPISEKAVVLGSAIGVPMCLLLERGVSLLLNQLAEMGHIMAWRLLFWGLDLAQLILLCRRARARADPPEPDQLGRRADLVHAGCQR